MKKMLKVLTVVATVVVAGLMLSPAAMARGGHGFRAGYHGGYSHHGYYGHYYNGGYCGWYYPSFSFSYSYYEPPPVYYYSPPPPVVEYRYSSPPVYYYSGGAFYRY